MGVCGSKYSSSGFNIDGNFTRSLDGPSRAAGITGGHFFQKPSLPALAKKVAENEVPYLLDALSKLLMFAQLATEQQTKLVTNMYIKKVPAGEILIREGEEGVAADELYVVKSGDFEVLQNHKGVNVRVNRKQAGDIFGEVAILYSVPRNATVVALSDSEVWVLERNTFNYYVRRNMSDKASSQLATRLDIFLNSVPLLAPLNSEERGELVRCLKQEHFEPGETIVTQGQSAQKFYMILEGEALTKQTNKQGKENVINELYQGEFFGEESVSGLAKPKYDLTIVASDEVNVSCLVLEGDDTFILHPLYSKMVREKNPEVLRQKFDVLKKAQDLPCPIIIKQIEEGGAASTTLSKCRGHLFEVSKLKDAKTSYYQTINSKGKERFQRDSIDETYIEGLHSIRRKSSTSTLSHGSVAGSSSVNTSFTELDFSNNSAEMKSQTLKDALNKAAEQSVGKEGKPGKEGEGSSSEGGITVEVSDYKAEESKGSFKQGDSKRSSVSEPAQGAPDSPKVEQPEDLVPDVDMLLSESFIASLKADMDNDKDLEKQKEMEEVGVVLYKDRLLGSGAFSVVNLVVEKLTQRKFAMKQIPKKAVKNCRSHILCEQKITRMITHPFVIRQYASFQDKGHLYFLFDYLPSGDLMDVLCGEAKVVTLNKGLFASCIPSRKQSKDGGDGRMLMGIDESLACFYVAQLVLVLGYLHKTGIVYRDLKPENVLVDAHGFIKLGDFGFAKELRTDRYTGEAENTYTFCGTPGYVAPENVFTQGYGFSVDWWSLGVLTYVLMTGKQPFNRPKTKDPMVVVQRIVDPNWEVFYPPYMSPTAKDLIVSLLKRDPKERLGCRVNGVEDIKKHKWFKDINWRALEAKKLPPPRSPTIVKRRRRSRAGFMNQRATNSTSFDNETKEFFNAF